MVVEIDQALVLDVLLLLTFGFFCFLFFSFCCFYVYSCGGPSPGLRAPGGAQADSPWSKPYASTDIKKKKKKKKKKVTPLIGIDYYLKLVRKDNTWKQTDGYKIQSGHRDALEYGMSAFVIE